MVSVFVLMSVTFAQAMVSVFALMRPFEVTRPVTSDHAIVSVFVLIPEMFPVPISEMRVATLLFTVVMSDQSIESVFVFTARRRAPSDDEALFVFAFTLAVLAEMALASEVEALLVFEFTEETALVTSDAVASEPVVSEAPVRVRVAYDQTSDAASVPAVRVRVAFDQMSDTNEPKVVSDRVPLAHTAAGIVEASEVEAVRTVALVFELMVEIAVAISESVFAFTLAVPAEIADASEVEALVI
jgi:hypothetical protein